MRILYFTDTRAIGGAERSLADLASGVADAGHDALLLAPQSELVSWFRRNTRGVSVTRTLSDLYHDAESPARRAAALAKMLRAAVRALEQAAPDVVHVNNGGFPGSDLCRIAPLAARFARVPCRVMTVHSNPWARDHLANRSIQTAADRLVWSSVSAVIAPSNAVAYGLQSRRGMPARLSRVIHYGVPRPHTDRAAAARLRQRLAPEDELVVGMVSARAVPEKGYDTFVEALAAVSPGVRGVLVGPCPKGLEAFARARGLGERLLFEGSQTAVGDYYQAFDVLVVASTAEECMPLVILEAASLGTPAFGSRLSGIPEAIRDGATGRLFETGSIRELAVLIDRAREERADLLQMGGEAKKRWQQQFAFDEMVRETLDLYRAGTR